MKLPYFIMLSFLSFIISLYAVLQQWLPMMFPVWLDMRANQLFWSFVYAIIISIAIQILISSVFRISEK